jgi:hypothetical protein
MTLDIPRAFEYIFKDPQWVSKLVITGIITLLAIATSPILIGLAGWAVLLGYQIALISNMRAGVTHPLPRWDDISEYFTTGGQALIGAVVYLLPMIITLGCISSMMFMFGGDDGSPMLVFLSLCCVIPISLLSALVFIPMYGLALGRFTDNPSVSVFFQFSSLFNALRANRQIVFGYLVASVLVGLVFGIINAVPCVGWLAGFALLTPVNGALTGQYVIQMMGDKAKRKVS